MGCFSWMFCDNPKKALKIGSKGYLLFPKEFGKNVKELCYDGYGIMGIYDVYELVAEWNREHLSEELLRPLTPVEEYGGLYSYQKDELRSKGMSENEIEALDYAKKKEHYENGVHRHNLSVKRLLDYKSKNLSDSQMTKKYGSDWKREIGIDIACYDEQNTALPYPIKIASADVEYESYPASLSDENQGF